MNVNGDDTAATTSQQVGHEHSKAQNTNPDESSSSDSFEENENALGKAEGADKYNNEDLPTDSVFVSRAGGGGLGVANGSADNAEAEVLTKDDSSPKQQSCFRRTYNRWRDFYGANSFLILVLCAILIAYAYPPLGAVYLAPQITATWIAVVFIFVLAGLGLKTAEFSKAFQRLYFNAFVHVFNFGVVSGGVFGFSRLLVAVGALAQSLADGMVICACLPLTINMVLVLTKSSGGDEAAAVFNAAFGNMIGVFLSPALILGYLGVQGEVNLGAVFYKLGLRVVLPICVGQLLQKFSKTAVDFVKKYKKNFKTAQEYCLVFIVYTVFCRTFLKGSDAGAGDVFIMIAVQFFLLCSFMVLAWLALRILFGNEPKLRAMGLFGCTHKTVAMGVPLINAIYEDHHMVGLYTLPLLIWHPMQLVIGSALAPRLAAWVKREEIRLGLAETMANDAQDEEGNTLATKENAC
mmetsp:Transcript_21396/g.39971  ORF Transcript_21396/g.39971 Transcript_21396/m.39971 type:complete len:464 (-) Transcript_21396:92-1483(-)|eukprot:CAMPEP_0197451278 /NCGR_PEP_ID=MMETSP1175-20131217/28332_1 /TAXON_ID=1003142 /ORGANISM="Triceratium dubium, Strain CCMP147" /LENGTH=463 /DNA_ID=CAMNT_0042983935 /DNA_START=248 /DNA_END=1639 /DNA_ORIENTATION=+